jgi:hypothetical protein
MAKKKVWLVASGRSSDAVSKALGPSNDLVAVKLDVTKRGDADGPLVEYWKSQNGRQSGDPAKLARALITIASQDPPPRRFIAGADAVATTEQKLADLKSQIDANRAMARLSCDSKHRRCGNRCATSARQRQ